MEDKQGNSAPHKLHKKKVITNDKSLNIFSTLMNLHGDCYIFYSVEMNNSAIYYIDVISIKANAIAPIYPWIPHIIT